MGFSCSVVPSGEYAAGPGWIIIDAERQYKGFGAIRKQFRDTYSPKCDKSRQVRRRGQMARRKAVEEQESIVQRLVLKGYSPSLIYEYMERKKYFEKPRPKLSKRTIERMVREVAPEDLSGPWSLHDADTETAAHVLDVLRYVFVKTEGRVWLSKAVGDCVAMIRAVYPSAPPVLVYAFARRYQALGADDDRRPFDLLLAALAASNWHIPDENVVDAIATWESRYGTMPPILLPELLEDFELEDVDRDPDGLDEDLKADYVTRDPGGEDAEPVARNDRLSELGGPGADNSFDNKAGGH
jgi:hypothetical protein